MPEFFSYLKKFPKFWQPVVNIFAGKPDSHHKSFQQQKKFSKYSKNNSNNFNITNNNNNNNNNLNNIPKWISSSCKYAEPSWRIGGAFSRAKSLEN